MTNDTKALEVAREIYKRCTATDDFDFNVTKCAKLIDEHTADLRTQLAERDAQLTEALVALRIIYSGDCVPRDVAEKTLNQQHNGS